MIWTLTPVAAVGDTIRLAVAPVFLLSGIATMLGVMTGRLALILSRSRVLAQAFKDAGSLDANQRVEIHLIPRRVDLINRAITMSVAAALAICLVIALLFVSNLVHLPTGLVVVVTFIVAMALMMGGLLSFLAEVRLALSLFYVDAGILAAACLLPAAPPHDGLAEHEVAETGSASQVRR